MKNRCNLPFNLPKIYCLVLTFLFANQKRPKKSKLLYQLIVIDRLTQIKGTTEIMYMYQVFF